MKKLESLKNSKFDSFESKRITSLAKVVGGYIYSASDASGCCDGYDWTARDLKNSKGEKIGTVNDRDNVFWFRCSVSDTTSVC